MKRIRMLTVITLVLCLAGIVSADLVAHYQFDEDASDSSGNAYNGILVGDANIANAERGNVLSLDGNGDYVAVEPEHAFDLFGPITVTAWIKVGVFDKDWQAIVTKGDTAWRLARDHDRDGLEFACTGVHFLRGNVNVNDGQWHHAAGVYDSRLISLYIDGVLDTSAPATSNIFANNADLRIGSNSERPGREWNGLIDDVRIYDAALNETEISQLAVRLVSFSYQGRLLDENGPADGLYDFKFDLYDAPRGGTVQGETICTYGLDVIDGYFTTILYVADGLFAGGTLWLEISVKPNGRTTEDFVTLNPRQRITPAPYAIHASDADRATYAETSAPDSDWMVSGDDMHSLVEGNVGIGTPHPTKKLSVIGPIRVSYDSDETEYIQMQHGGLNGYIKWGGGGNLDFRYETENLASITPEGGIGIGTREPDAKLDVISTDGAAATIGAEATTASGVHAIALGARAEADSNYSIAMGTTVKTTGLYSTAIGTDITVSGMRSVGIGIGASGADINSNNVMAVMGGKVGVGTTDPEARLDVVNTSSEGAAVYGRATATGTDTSAKGGHFTTDSDYGDAVLGEASSANAVGVHGRAKGAGVRGVAESIGGRGVDGRASASTGVNYGVYGSTGSLDGYAGYFDGRVKVEGDLIVSGVQSFPRPAYDSGWKAVPNYTTTLTHNLGGDSLNYVVDLQFKHSTEGTTNKWIGGFQDWDIIRAGMYWHNLNDTIIKVSGGPSNLFEFSHFRVRIWVYE